MEMRKEEHEVYNFRYPWVQKTVSGTIRKNKLFRARLIIYFR